MGGRWYTRQWDAGRTGRSTYSELLPKVCAGLDVQLVLSLGGGGKPEDMEELAGEPIVVEFAPQLELLKRAALCITHAGLNTALECLSNGVLYGGDSNHQRPTRVCSQN